MAPAGPKNTVFGGSKNVARVRKCIEMLKLKAENLSPSWLDARYYSMLVMLSILISITKDLQLGV